MKWCRRRQRRWVACMAGALAASSAWAARGPVDVITEDVTRFKEFLGSSLPERRVEGIQGLSNLKHWDAEDALLGLLDDRAPVVRREAGNALCRLGTAKSVPRLIALLDDPSWEIRENARLGLGRLTAQDFPVQQKRQWQDWWSQDSLALKEAGLLGIARLAASSPRASATATSSAQQAAAPDEIAPGRRRRARSPATRSPACPARREALRALRHLATSDVEPGLLELLQRPQTPPLDADERAFLAEALERIGSASAVPTLAREQSDAAAWALGRIGGTEAESALLKFPKTLAVLLALDRLHSTNCAALIPQLVGQMGLITYRGQPDDLMNEEEQPIQRVGANLIRRSEHAPLLTELVLEELEDTMKPRIAHGSRPACPPEWEPMLQAMRSELKPGFVRGDGTTTSQPIVAICYLLDGKKVVAEGRNHPSPLIPLSVEGEGRPDSALVQRLIPLLQHPAIVPRVYVALALGRVQAREALRPMAELIREGYAFSDATALASGKHFDQSQTVRWRGFVCLALGRMGGDEARRTLEEFAGDSRQPRDVRYGAVVGLGFISSPNSLEVLQRVGVDDIIWLVRDEARRVAQQIETLARERSLAEVRP